jgi:hypothetical protein
VLTTSNASILGFAIRGPNIYFVDSDDGPGEIARLDANGALTTIASRGSEFVRYARSFDPA